MNVPELIESMNGLQGLAALITSLIALFQIRRVKTDTEQLHPNHGSSMRDEMREGFRRIDHELGEIRRASDREHEDYDQRIRTLEQRD